jgi:hypothetical protein
MGYHFGGGHCDNFVIPFEGSLKLQDNSSND